MRARLIIDSTRRSPDLLYLTGFRAPDPVVWIQLGTKRFLVLSDLELDRGRRTARVNSCIPYSRAYRRAREKLGRIPSAGHVAGFELATRGARTVEVPGTFPAMYLAHLEKAGVHPVICRGPFVPARRRKRRFEVVAMRRCQRAGEKGIALAVDLIRRARRRGRRLFTGSEVLTAEIIKREVSLALLADGYQAAGLIVAGRPEQTCLPHHAGNGPILEGQSIILDFFPRSLATGYHGDETRTVVRGRPSREIAGMWKVVREAEKRGAAMLVPGAKGAEIHAAVTEFMTREGFATDRTGSRPRGFFHGLGHGLGLEIHEQPSLSAADTVIEVGDVITVEPGLYYPRIGGVRHENLYHVGRSGTEPLSRLELDLAI